MSWTLYALLAFFFIGIQRFFYNIAAKLHLSSIFTTFIFMLTVATLSGLYIFYAQISINLNFTTILLSLLNSFTFSCATIAHINALKYSPSPIVYPYIRLNIVLVVLYSYFILREPITLSQFMGIILSLITLFFMSYEFKPTTKATKFFNFGFFWATIALICGAASSISCKYGSIYVDKLVFIFLSYIFSTIFLFLGFWLFNINNSIANNKTTFLAIIIGISMGILNIFGFYCYLMALSSGPLSIVATINGMHFVLGVVLSSIFFKEKINMKNAVGILLTIIALMLLT